MRIFIYDHAKGLLIQRTDMIVSVHANTSLKIIGIRNKYISSLRKASCNFLQRSDDDKSFEYKKDFLLVEKAGEFVAIRPTGNIHNDNEIIKAIDI